MASLNKVMLIGRLTRDPEMRYTPSGQPVTNFSIATNRYQTNAQGERREFTDYHNIVVWNIGRRTLAELAGQHLRKGSLVYIEGRLQTRSWESQTGEKRKATEVVCDNLEFLDSRPGGGQPALAGGPDEIPGLEDEPARDVDPDEIPF